MPDAVLQYAWDYVHNPYGLLRSPWNLDPTPYVTRHDTTSGTVSIVYEVSRIPIGTRRFDRMYSGHGRCVDRWLVSSYALCEGTSKVWMLSNRNADLRQLESMRQLLTICCVEMFHLRTWPRARFWHICTNDASALTFVVR